jgi:hypothetical protein
MVCTQLFHNFLLSITSLFVVRGHWLEIFPKTLALQLVGGHPAQA